MDKLQGCLNKIDNIINLIENNNSLKKINHGDNLKSLIELNKKEKNNLEKKLNTIEIFSKKIENIITIKPKPETLDINLIDYIGYNDYYLNNKTNK